MDGAAGEEGNAVLRVTFDPRLKLEFHGSKVTSDAGLLPFRDLDDALGLTDLAGEALTDTRTGQNSRHTLIAQLRQSVFGRLAGYEDVNDAERLGRDPAMRWIVGGRAVTEQAASTSQDGSLRDRRADRRAESAGAGRPLRALDRPRPGPPGADQARARYRQQREPDLRRAGRDRIQRPLPLHLLPPAVRVQPRRGSRTVRAAPGQCAQCRRLAGRAGSGGRPVLRPTGPSPATCRCRLRVARRVRVPGGRGIPIR